MLLGEQVELGLRIGRIEILDIVAGDGEMVAVAVERGRLALGADVGDDRHRLGDQHLVAVEAVGHDAGDVAEQVALEWFGA